nr:unnamed protein product [Callosobruchus analis]
MAHFSAFKSLLEREKYDIIGISETWLNCNISDDLIQISGYSFVRRDRNGRGGGVGMFVRNNLAYSVIHAECHTFLEEIWIEIKFEKVKYAIGCSYRPTKGCISDFVQHFEDTLAQLLDSYIIYYYLRGRY